MNNDNDHSPYFCPADWDNEWNENNELESPEDGYGQ